MDSPDRLPQPLPGARTVLEVVEAILSEVPFAAPAVRALIDNRIKAGQRIILEEIRAKGMRAIDDLSDSQIDFFVPASYRFFEQVRLGEYEHNLRVIARQMAGEMAEDDSRDVGRIARTARCLEMASLDELRCIAHIKRAVEIYFADAKNQESTTSIEHHKDIFTPLSLQRGLEESGIAMEMYALRNAVWSLTTRGVIAESKYWFTQMDSTGYTATNLYFEIVSSCSGVV
jgi:hypothetical protein